MGTTTYFCGKIRQILCGYPVLSGAMLNYKRKNGLEKAPLNSEVVLVPSCLSSGIPLYLLLNIIRGFVRIDYAVVW